ncbi:uncharacterized protein MONBRDRAFT_24871 [Monosiga brevicollis MX1]|uniref:UDENN FLCN/SMCR8-type domain-containing protein n=1 Tax=Monosiga brevicollis TaxID=81824 RepID=A9UY00_MONBE|nr:uncharacterized protein MONBRDRAFT_24871 [Monosiga brevicollis MX1]EDQ89774.1 predicted protein [Monosiga brevicollis MX1]|eukprot:XP_001745196.1 hypothetical protein [Monosiga brevicollis MX1]
MSIPVDAQSVLSHEDGITHAIVHYVALYDIDARGYTRSYCLAYVANDLSKVMQHYTEIVEELDKMARLLHYSNYLDVMAQISNRLHRLEATTDDIIQSQIPGGGEQLEKALIARAQQRKDMLSLQSHVEQIMRTDSQYNDIMDRHERSMLTDLDLSTAPRTARQHRTFSFNSTRGASGRRTRSLSFTDRISQLCQPTANDDSPIDFSVNRDYLKSLRPLSDICQAHFYRVQNQIRRFYKHYHRNAAVLDIEQEEAALLIHPEFLLTIGRCVVTSFFVPTCLRTHTAYFCCSASHGLACSSASTSMISDIYTDNTSMAYSVNSDVFLDDGGAPYNNPFWFDYDAARDSSAGGLGDDDLSLYSARDDLSTFSPRDRITNIMAVHEAQRCSSPRADLRSVEPSKGRAAVARLFPVLSEEEPATPVNRLVTSTDTLRLDSVESVETPHPKTPLDQLSSGIVVSVHDDYASSGPPDEASQASNHSLRLRTNRRPRFPFQSAADHVISDSRTKPGTGLLQLRAEIPYLKHILYALFSGVPTLVVGDEKEVRGVIRALSFCVPCHYDTAVVEWWPESELVLRDLAALRLIGMSVHAAKHVSRVAISQVAIFDINSDTYWGPRYKGTFLEKMTSRAILFPDETTLLAHMHEIMLKMSWKSFRHFHDTCLSIIDGVRGCLGSC